MKRRPTCGQRMRLSFHRLRRVSVPPLIRSVVLLLLSRAAAAFTIMAAPVCALPSMLVLAVLACALILSLSPSLQQSAQKRQRLRGPQPLSPLQPSSSWALARRPTPSPPVRVCRRTPYGRRRIGSAPGVSLLQGHVPAAAVPAVGDQLQPQQQRIRPQQPRAAISSSPLPSS